MVKGVFLENLSSPPLTSSNHPRNSATSVQESAYLTQASKLRWARLGLSLLAVTTALAIVGCTGHVLHCYNQGHMTVNWVVPLKPNDVDLKPTLGTMIPAAMIAAMSLVYVLFSAIPSVRETVLGGADKSNAHQPRSRILYQVLVFLGISSIAVVATLFALFFDVLLLHYIDANSRETLHTWTCKFYYGTQDFENASNDLKIPIVGAAVVPSDFKRLCMESQAGSWMTAGLLVVELGCLIVGIWGYLAERKIKISRHQRYGGQKNGAEHD